MPTQHIGWINIARGIAIVMVVFHHAVIFDDAIGIAAASVTGLDNLLVSVRMPLFFVCAGLLGVSAVRGGWLTTWSKRISTLVWLYALWSVIRFAVFLMVEWPLDTSEAGTVSSLARSLWAPSGTLWFIFALALYFAVAQATAAVKTWLVLVPSGALSIAFSSFATTGDYEWDSILTYAFFFLAALRFRDLIIAQVSAASLPLAVAAVVALAAIAGAAYVLDVQDMIGVRLVTGVTAVAALMFTCRWVDRLPWAGWIGQIGTRTLPVYLLHYFFIAFAVVYADRFLSSLPMPAVVSALALTTAATALSLAVHAGTKRIPGLYGAPRWLSADKRSLTQA